MSGTIIGSGTIVNASGSTLYSSSYGVWIEGTPAGVINEGYIGANDYGVILSSGGYVSNASSGTITARYAIEVWNNPGTVVNAGQIAGQVGNGVVMFAGGYVSNASSGTISGGGAIWFAREPAVPAGTIVNAGLIAGTYGGYGVYLGSYQPGTVTNLAGGTISGDINDGVRIRNAGATVTNAGTISGGAYAVNFAANYTNRLIADAGAVFIGPVSGGTPADATLELASSSSTGTLSGFGTQFTNFGTLQFDSGANWLVTGSGAAFQAATIVGLSSGDTIDVTGFAATSGTFASNHLILADGVGNYQTLSVTGSFTTSQFSFTNAGGNTQIANTICYLRGTRILTATGEVAVEELRAGDMLVTLIGRLQPLKWVGRQSFDGRLLGKDRAPVCFHTGSIADNVPSRDLYVSPAHSVLIGGKLAIADLLVNGATVTQTATDERVDYFHLDLGPHDCVVANGAWAESYAAQNNRAQFHNLAEFEAAFPGVLGTEAFQPLCLPQVAAGDPALAEIRALLLARVPDNRFATDGDVRLLADGIRIEAVRSGENTWVFEVPAGVWDVRLMSRASRPCSLGINSDDRMLGFCISEISVSGGATLRGDDAGFATGVHAAESDGASVWRWTDGDCRLPDSLFAGDAPVTLALRGRTMERYFRPAAEKERLVE